MTTLATPAAADAPLPVTCTPKFERVIAFAVVELPTVNMPVLVTAVIDVTVSPPPVPVLVMVTAALVPADVRDKADAAPVLVLAMFTVAAVPADDTVNAVAPVLVNDIAATLAPVLVNVRPVLPTAIALAAVVTVKAAPANEAAPSLVIKKFGVVAVILYTCTTSVVGNRGVLPPILLLINKLPRPSIN